MKLVKNLELNKGIIEELSVNVSKKRPAQLFAERFRMSNENRDIKLAMAQARNEKKEKAYQKMIETQVHCRLKYYK